jgi:short-chain fatty acids transporter
MLARFGQRVAAWFRATAPDPFVIAIILTVIAGIASALTLWSTTAATPNPVALPDAAWDTIGFWHTGIWKLLAFSMEMCLILVTGHALAASPIVSRSLRALASLAHTPRRGVALTAACAMAAALINWGFGLIVGAILARNVIASLRARGIDAPAGLIAGAGYLGLMVWHGGLSGSAPLTAASAQRQLDVLGPDLAARIGAVPVTQTLLSPLNLIITAGLCIIALALATAMAPSRVACSSGVAWSKARPRAAGHDSSSPTESEDRVRGSSSPDSDAGRFPQWLERSPLIVWLIALPALALITVALRNRGLAALDLGIINLLMLALGLIAHGSARSYCAAVEDAARGCAGIIIQFPLYAGIMGMVQSSGLGALLSTTLINAAGNDAGLLSVMGVLAACTVNLFVPSGGGQWAVQGPVFLEAAAAINMPPGRMIMAIAYGDQLTNMLQPFWALPLLAITRVPAREIVGYTAIIMLAAILWTCACMWLF